jgi:hypothetical protein
MRRLEKLPPAFKRFEAVGGAIDFTIFEDADGDDAAIEGICRVFADDAGFDRARLAALGGRAVGRRRFLGDWCDPESNALLKRGDWSAASGKHLRDPPLTALARERIVSGGFSPPSPGSGGQFAYAFSEPPYGLRSKPGETQELFDEITAHVLPRDVKAEILDWSSPQLPEVSACFAAGMEWWGVFLFSIHLPALRRLTIAIASTTD